MRRIIIKGDVKYKLNFIYEDGIIKKYIEIKR